MSGALRSALLLVVGVVLGVGLAVSSTVWTELSARHAPQADPTLDPDSAALFADVVARVRHEYVDSIDDRKLVESAIRGILKDLDPHSSYLDPSQYEDIRISTSGNYTGVGLDVNLDEGKVTVVTPLDGAPAARAGILPGDVVVSVDDVVVDSNNVEEAVSRMRGAVGTEVMVDVLRDGSDVPIRFALTRSEVRVQTVMAEDMGNGLVYVRVGSFAEGTPRDLSRALHELTASSGTSLRGLVLDLRSNPGGVLDSAVRIADQFLADGLIVRGTGRLRQARFEEFATRGDDLEQVPTVVLVNSGSASASEIVAGALQDHHRARVVGERTYGKGSVQTVMPLGEGRALKLTTSLYLTPSGRSINGAGVEPDVVVQNPRTERQYRGAGGSVPLAEDPQLLEALRLISYDSIQVSAVQ